MLPSNSLTLRPLDILLLGKLVVSKRDEAVRQMDLAAALKISQASVSQSFKRLIHCRLIGPSGDYNPKAVEEFFVHGLKYMLPAEVGALTRGIATGHGAPPLRSKIRSSEGELYVWPDPEGSVRGQAVTPVHESMVWAAKQDPKLYEFFALVDAIRIGRAREVEIAAREIHNRIQGAG